MNMKQTYETPIIGILLLQTEEIMTLSNEESFDIGVEFKDLWNGVEL